VVCGSLTGRSAEGTTCSHACQEQATTVSRLVHGEAVGGFTCLRDYLNENGREERSQAGEKRCLSPVAHASGRRETRTSRAEAWLGRRVREKPGHVTRATLLYAAYRAWAQQHDPKGALSYTAFVRMVDQGAPVERVVRLRTERGRPQLAFEGIVLSGSRAVARRP